MSEYETLEIAGYIVHDNERIIHGYGATADLAWADMLRTMAAAQIDLVSDDFDTSNHPGSYIRESGMKLAPATRALLDMVETLGGDRAWGSVGMVACTCDEEDADAEEDRVQSNLETLDLLNDLNAGLSEALEALTRDDLGACQTDINGALNLIREKIAVLENDE